MTLPTLTKTWQFYELLIGDTGTALGNNRAILLAIKNALISTSSWKNNTNASTTPTGMWTVRGSSNSSASANVGDGVDRWTTATDLVWANAGNAHSWIVLRNTAIASNTEILISCEGLNASGAVLTIYMSPAAGFTGGTTTARPTATDEVAALAGAAWGGSGTTTGDVRIHLMKSSDSECWRVFAYKSGVCLTAWFVEKARTLHASWTNPATIGTFGSNTAEVLTVANLNTASPFQARGVSSMTLSLVLPSAAGSIVPTSATSANDLSGQWEDFACQLRSATASNRGTHGYLTDVWAVSSSITSGSNAPSSTTPLYQFFTSGILLFPYKQTAFLVG